MIDLSDVPVVDNHVHPWRGTTQRVTAERLAGCVAFSDEVVGSVRREFLPAERLEPSLRLFRETNLGSHYLLGALADLLHVERSWPAVAAARNAAAEADYHAWAGRLFADVGLDCLLVDEGGGDPRITLNELASIVPIGLRRVARCDNFIRDLLPVEETWRGFFQRYQVALDDAIADGAVAFKSVIAYRTGLHVEPVPESEARADFEAHRLEPEGAQKIMCDFLLCHTMDVARERGVWLHIHVGVGDPDIVYEHAHPAQLYPLLHSERFRENRVVLIHGGWPWTGEAAAMAAILPNVYLDLSESALYGLVNIRQRIMEALEACPYSKILYGADGSLPEAVWIGARRFKSVLARVLAYISSEGLCTASEAHSAGRLILHDNAARMYGL